MTKCHCDYCMDSEPALEDDKCIECGEYSGMDAYCRKCRKEEQCKQATSISKV
jgi:hypothetical protein